MKTKILRGVGIGLVWMCLPNLALAGNGQWTVVAWNNLGMHCMDDDYSVFSILPPFNTINAQVMDAAGDLITNPAIAGITVTYESVASPDGSIDTTALGKTNFYDFAAVLFGVALTVDQGLAGKAPSLVNYDTYNIPMWGDFALTALTLIDTNAPLNFNIAASSPDSVMGTVVGAGTYDSGTSCTLSASANAGYYFVNCTEGGVETSVLADYSFTVGADRVLVANFAKVPVITPAAPAVPGAGFTFAWPGAFTGWVLEKSPDLNSGGWVPSAETITTSAGQKSITVPAPTGHRFFRLKRPYMIV